MEQSSFAAWIGLDWARYQHAWSLADGVTQQIEQGLLEQNPEAVRAWALALEQRYGGQPVAVALEQSHGALLAQLSEYAHLVLFIIHPASLVSYRRSRRPSRAKSDASDASLLREYLERHAAELRPWQPDTAAMRALQALVEQRRIWVDERTRYTNRLHQHLQVAFPQAVEWFGAIDSAPLWTVLERYPRLCDLQGASWPQLQRFLVRQLGWDLTRCRQFREPLAQAPGATTDPGLLDPLRWMVQSCVALCRQFTLFVGQLEKEIQTRARALPDYALFASFPAAGPVMLPRLLAAFGSRRERWQSAAELQCYAGIAPVTESSGRQRVVHRRWACPAFVRQTFHEWAALTVRYSAWARACYDELRGRGKRHHVAVRALAYKWIRILFRCWQERRPYEEQQYQQALLRRTMAAA